MLTVPPRAPTTAAGVVPTRAVVDAIVERRAPDPDTAPVDPAASVPDTDAASVEPVAPPASSSPDDTTPTAPPEVWAPCCTVEPHAAVKMSASRRAARRIGPRRRAAGAPWVPARAAPG